MKPHFETQLRMKWNTMVQDAARRIEITGNFNDLECQTILDVERQLHALRAELDALKNHRPYKPEESSNERS